MSSLCLSIRGFPAERSCVHDFRLCRRLYLGGDDRFPLRFRAREPLIAALCSALFHPVAVAAPSSPPAVACLAAHRLSGGLAMFQRGEPLRPPPRKPGRSPASSSLPQEQICRAQVRDEASPQGLVRRHRPNICQAQASCCVLERGLAMFDRCSTGWPLFRNGPDVRRPEASSRTVPYRDPSVVHMVGPFSFLPPALKTSWRAFVFYFRLSAFFRPPRDIARSDSSSTSDETRKCLG